MGEIEEVLRMSGYDTTTFSYADEALENIHLEKPDVILLDLKMNGASGFKVADELQRSPEIARIPAIARTGVYTKGERMLPIKMCGFKKRLIKPANPLGIITAIAYALRGEAETV